MSLGTLHAVSEGMTASSEDCCPAPAPAPPSETDLTRIAAAITDSGYPAHEVSK